MDPFSHHNSETNPTLQKELAADRPRTSVAQLSRHEREILIERGFRSLYRWYLQQTHSKRNWSPDTSFDWSSLRRDHSPQIVNIVEGFYAVEQFAPDYTTELTRLTRSNYGRSHFHIQWGAEEERHADVWCNTLLHMHGRSASEIESYTHELRRSAWSLPWNNPIHMIFYTVLQERATELIYLNLAKLTQGRVAQPCVPDHRDPVLAHIARTVAIDEAAHFNFFLEGARLYLFYQPDEAIPALTDVLRGFMMPAADLIPNYDEFTRDLYEVQLFGRWKYVREVVDQALAKLGVLGVRELESAMLDSRHGAPSPAEDTLLVTAWTGLDGALLETTVHRLFSRLNEYERRVGAPHGQEGTFELLTLPEEAKIPAGWS